jgi:hypothetical protein
MCFGRLVRLDIVCDSSMRLLKLKIGVRLLCMIIKVG